MYLLHMSPQIVHPRKMLFRPPTAKYGTIILLRRVMPLVDVTLEVALCCSTSIAGGTFEGACVVFVMLADRG